MRIIAENPSPYPRVNWVKVATPGGFHWRQLAIDGAGRLDREEPLEESIEAVASDAMMQPPFAIYVNGELVSFHITGQTLEHPCVVVHFRGRAQGSPLVFDLWATVIPGSGIVPFELLAVNSDPRVPELYTTATVVLVSFHKLKPFVWWGPWRGTQPEKADAIVLLENETIADTQGQAWAGFFAFNADAEGAAWQYGPVMAMAHPLEWDGKWGPFGATPRFDLSEHAYISEISNWFLKMVLTNANYPWLAPDLGLSPNPNATGGQQGFGVTKLGPAFMRAGGGSLHALHALQAALMECCRPGDFREADGSPAVPWAHPNHVTWSFYTHWHTSVSSDRLGKVGPTPSWIGSWAGKDREHWSSLNLCGAYLLTGSHILLHRIECEARIFLSGETVDPRLSTSHAGAPRGIGRTFLTASWIDCCLPEGELRTRFRQRVRERLELVARETFSDLPVAPLGVITDPRAIPNVPCVAPWQEAQGIIGLRAAMLRFPDAAQLCEDMLRRVCRTFIDYGWWKDQAGRWWMADYHAYNDGQPLPPEAYPGPLVVRREGFEEWSWGAVRIAHLIVNSPRSAEIAGQIPAPTKAADAEWLAVT